MSAALVSCDTTAHATQLPARTGTPDSAPVRSACTRQKDASSLRVLVLIGVAACAFCAAFNPHMTKPSKLAEASCPISVTPRWLPVLLASNSTRSPSSGEISPPPPEVCGACTVDYSDTGVPCCDAAWAYNWTCAELSTRPTLLWDCSGCNCPGDPSPPPPSPPPLPSPPTAVAAAAAAAAAIATARSMRSMHGGLFGYWRPLLRRSLGL